MNILSREKIPYSRLKFKQDKLSGALNMCDHAELITLVTDYE